MLIRTLFVLVLFSCGLVFQPFGSNTQASIFCYELHDHPDGNQSPPPYGLRYDDLEGPGTGVYTFEFDGAAQSGIANWQQMRLYYDDVAQTIHVVGHLYGGRIQDPPFDDSYDPTKVGTFFLDYTYNVGVSRTGDRLTADEHATNGGTLTQVATSNDWMDGQSISLSDKSNGSDSLIFDTDGHRMGEHWGDTPGWSGGLTYGALHNAGKLFVGRGWHKGDGTRDFLFTGWAVPEPSTAIIWSAMGLGCAAFGLRRRRA